MKVLQQLYKNGKFETNKNYDNSSILNPTLILGFGAKNIIQSENIYSKLKENNPTSNIVLCSTAGEIFDDVVYDNTVSIVSIEFEKTTLKTVSVNIANFKNSTEAGNSIFNQLQKDDLSYVLVISDGGIVNGSDLVNGLNENNINKIPITGGLAGDADNFDYTLVGCNQNPEKGTIVAIGFYGKYLQIGHGSMGGWNMFGPEKKVTKSIANRLYELDDNIALEVYKQYLGKYADELPGSALLFPLCILQNGTDEVIVRTILSIDNNDNHAMVFAGNIPEGSTVRFMKANFDKLIDAATVAAQTSFTSLNEVVELKPKLALLISCVGRKLILGNRVDEEVEAIKNVFGEKTTLSGFYSYGEISPINAISQKCELHNQTMTITTFNEL